MRDRRRGLSFPWTAGFLAVGFLPSVFAGENMETRKWTVDARRLSGESERVRSDAIDRLRRTPNLREHLRVALRTPDRFLALDAAVALEMEDMVPDLLEYANEDPTGYSYHALNALVPAKKRKELLETYQKRVSDPHLSPAVKMALIDSLARSSVEIPHQVLDRLGRDPVPEVRDSVLGYLRASVLRYGRRSDRTRIARFTKDPAGVLRARASSILVEIAAGIER